MTTIRQGTTSHGGARDPLTSRLYNLDTFLENKTTPLAFPQSVVFTMSREVSREGEPFFGAALGRLGGTTGHGGHHRS